MSSSIDRVCKVERCGEPAERDGLCASHLLVALPQRAARRERQGCGVEGCDRKALARGYCATHLKRIERTGSPQGDVPVQVHSGPDQICKTVGCGKPTVVKRNGYSERGALGYCRACYRARQAQIRKARQPQRRVVFA